MNGQVGRRERRLESREVVDAHMAAHPSGGPLVTQRRGADLLHLGSKNSASSRPPLLYVDELRTREARVMSRDPCCGSAETNAASLGRFIRVIESAAGP